MANSLNEKFLYSHLEITCIPLVLQKCQLFYEVAGIKVPHNQPNIVNSF